MKKINNRIFLLAGMFFFTKTQGQIVELKQDTITVFSIVQVDRSKNLALKPNYIFKIRDKFHLAESFKFSTLNCNATIETEYKLYFLDFAPIIKEKSISKLLKKFNRKKFESIDNINFIKAGFPTKSIIDLIECFKVRKEDYLIKQMEFTASYFLINCNPEFPVSKTFFCTELVDSISSPVFLELKIL